MRGMADKPSVVNELLDILENLLIENRAYVGVLRHLAPNVQMLADRMIETAKADPKLRETIRAKFAPFRDLSPEQALVELYRFLSKKDLN